MTTKNPAAVSLGRRRWAGSTPAERTEATRTAAAAGWAQLSPRQRAAKLAKLQAGRAAKQKTTAPRK